MHNNDASKITGKLSAEELAEAQEIRDFQANPKPLNFVVSDDEDDDLIFPSAPNGTPFTGGGFTPAPAFNDPMATHSASAKKSGEDRFWDALGIVGKGAWNFTKTLGKSFKSATAVSLAKTGRMIAVTGLTWAGVSLLLWFITLFTGSTKLPLDMLIGAVVTTGIGLVWFISFYDKAKLETLREKVNENDDDIETVNDFNLGFTDDDEALDTFNNFEFEEYEEDDDDFDLTVEEPPIFAPPKPVSVKEAQEKLAEINITPGTQTRQFLYEQLSSVLPTINPAYTSVTEIDRDSQTFLGWEQTIRTICRDILKVKDTDLPELLSITETLFKIEFRFTRTSANFSALANEMVKSFTTSTTGVIPEEMKSVYAECNDWDKFAKIDLFKPTSKALISLKDAYANCSQWVQDPSVLMPVVLGVKEDGEVVFDDFNDVHSLTVQGQPRKGKSWTVKSIFLQLATYLSPKQVNFYFCDPKGSISDLRMLTRLPHTKAFASDLQGILKMMRFLVNTEGPRRKKLFENADVIQLPDYWKKLGNDSLPMIFLAIDEMVSLSQLFQGEEKKEYFKLLTILVTQMPAVGIRFVGTPHRLTDDILPKTVYENVGFRLAVGANQDELTRSLGTKPSTFPRQLATPGDCALKASTARNNGDAFFLKAVMFTDDSDHFVEVTEFIAGMWQKLMPETVVKPSVESFEEPAEVLQVEKRDTSNLVSAYDAFGGPDEGDFWDDILK